MKDVQSRLQAANEEIDKLKKENAELQDAWKIQRDNLMTIRSLITVLNRQRTLFEKTRKFLKDKWKVDVKRMLDAENSFFKRKTTYYQRCQTGVKLREKLATAQNLLNELSASLMQ
ncbi:unnamed protein product [Schistosoma intercalatum]|nr:unnamed protein product [Schistosoma intercalatum]